MSTVIQPGFFSRRAVVCLCWGWMLVLPAAVWGQTNFYATNGAEYAIIGSLPGDQVHPDVAVTTGGGFAVWQDNITDGDGWGVSAMQLNGTLSGSGSSFRVNVQGAGDQENPRVALLRNGGAVFVWQGGVGGLNQHIYARFLSAGGIWLSTNDTLVNTFTNNFQVNPAVATLANGNVIIVWASFDQAGASSLQDVYGRIYSPTGTPLTGELPINQVIAFNQRTPAVTALAGGGFVVAWVSEQERVPVPGVGGGSLTVTNGTTAPVTSVDVYARLFNNNGNALGNEFLVNSDFNPCANPDTAAGSDGGFMITWGARDLVNLTNSMDVYARAFNSAGVGGTVSRVNSYLYGDQYGPRIASLGTDYLIEWTSMGEDGSREGVFAQFLRGSGSMVGGEFQVNTTTAGPQIQPVVASDGVGQFLTIWSSFSGVSYGMDLYAQRYINTQQPLAALPAPFVWAPFVVTNGTYLPQLLVSWPPVTGLSVSNYEVYVDGSASPTVATTSNVWMMTSANGLANNSTHSFQVDYLTTDGRKSPPSPSTSGTTWQGYSWGGIPFEWMTRYYGSDISKWPGANTVVAPGGQTLLQVFLTGGDPTNPATWLRTALSNTPEGLFLSWNTQPGFTYQVQTEATLGGTWTNLGAARFAAGTTDSIYVGKSSAGYYRVLLLRQ